MNFGQTREKGRNFHKNYQQKSARWRWHGTQQCALVAGQTQDSFHHGLSCDYIQCSEWTIQNQDVLGVPGPRGNEYEVWQLLVCCDSCLLYTIYTYTLYDKSLYNVEFISRFPISMSIHLPKMLRSSQPKGWISTPKKTWPISEVHLLPVPEKSCFQGPLFLGIQGPHFLENELASDFT